MLRIDHVLFGFCLGDYLTKRYTAIPKAASCLKIQRICRENSIRSTA